MKRNVRFIVLSMLLTVFAVCNAQTPTLKEVVTKYYQKCMTQDCYHRMLAKKLRNYDGTSKYIPQLLDSCTNKAIVASYINDKFVEDFVDEVLPIFEKNITSEELLKVVDNVDSLYCSTDYYRVYVESVVADFNEFSNIVYSLTAAKKPVNLKRIECDVPQSYKDQVEFIVCKLPSVEKLYDKVNAMPMLGTNSKQLYCDYMQANARKFLINKLYEYIPEEFVFKELAYIWENTKTYTKLLNELQKNEKDIFNNMTKKIDAYVTDTVNIAKAVKKAKETNMDSVRFYFNYDVCEKNPEFKGGDPELIKWLQHNLRYPRLAQENGVQSRILVGFVVDKDGSICKTHVISSSVRDSHRNEITLEVTDDPKIVEKIIVEESGRLALEAEATRVVNAMPRWMPGTVNDKPVKVKYTLPVTFRLQ